MIRKWSALAVLACAFAPALSAHVGTADPSGFYFWVDDREPGFEFTDPKYPEVQQLPLVGDATAPVPLPFVLSWFGRAYDHAEATADGRLVLRFVGGQTQALGEHGELTTRTVPSRADVAILDVFQGVRPGAGSLVTYAGVASQVSFRWVSFETSPRTPVTFEAQLRSDGRVRFQYWSMRPYLTGPDYGRVGSIGIADPSGAGGLTVMSRGVPSLGFDLRSGSVVEFPRLDLPDQTDPAAPHGVSCDLAAYGLPPDFANWCLRTAAGPDRIAGTADDNAACTVNTNDGTHTPCTQGSATQWLFREGDDYCQNCPYTFYVRVDCGTDMHMPTHDVEAMQVQITDMNTGLLRTVTAENECAKRRDVGDPLIYCDGCGTPVQAIVRKDEPFNNGLVDKPANSCNATSIIGPISLPERPCLPYRETGTTVAWGTPLAQPPANPDQDGSGYIEQDEMDTPPCTTCGAPACQCGSDTNANALAEEQDIDVVLFGNPTLTGVYRLEILSGGLEWQLYTNCNGDETPQYAIYDRCDAALADYNPLPQLSLSDDPATGFGFQIVDSSGCPTSIRVAVTMCNVGGAPSSAAPFTIRFLDGTGNPVGAPFEGDVATATNCDTNAGLPLGSDECRTCYFDLTPGSADLTAVIEVDRNFIVAECSEDPLAVRCTLGTGPRTRPILACAANCTADAQLEVVGDPFCVGERVTLDGNRSALSSCAGVAEYQFEEFDAALGAYAPLPGGTFSPSPTYTYVPPTTGAHRVRVVVRCSSDPTCTSNSPSVSFTVQADVDNDGISEACGDNCPTVANPGQEDVDGDFVGEACDNCPGKFNPNQENSDGDPLGDECDNCRFDTNPAQENADGDTLGDECDNCPGVINDGLVDQNGDGTLDGNTYGEFPQSDLDNDTVGDVCDNCPFASNPLHLRPTDCNADTDTDDPGEAVGQQCDQDGDGVGDVCDNCLRTANPRNPDPAGFDCDADGLLETGPGQEQFGEVWLGQCDQDADTIGDACDNCPVRSNPTQADTDEDPPGSGTPRPDGVGNACDNCPFVYNPVHPAPFDCNVDGDTTDPGEGAGQQCNACACGPLPPPEVASGVDPDAHLVIEKGQAQVGIWITSKDPVSLGGDYSAELYGATLTANLLDNFNLYRGTIPVGKTLGEALADGDRASEYDHVAFDVAEACAVTTGMTEPRPAPGRPSLGVYDRAACGAGTTCTGDGFNYYYLVVGECAADSVEGPYGYASPDGNDRSLLVPVSTAPCP